MEDYVSINGRKFKKGYTTGSCAAAASKAAVAMLASGTIIDKICIDTPSGIRLNLPLSDVELNGKSAKCSVIKDGGDDPDVTNGLKIFASVIFTCDNAITLKTGEGIGIVTLPGLKVEVGKPAINPVPYRMIMKEVREVLPEGKGVEITLSVPGGEVIALRTYNPKLGIIGGISILGTTGIVNPMSEDAWKDALELELSVIAAKGIKVVVFTFGNYGEDFAKNQLNIQDDRIVKVSNFIGFMLDKATEYKFEKLLLIGHLGKLIKVAAGIFQTHSRVADARREIMAAYAALEGASNEDVAKIYDCVTTESAALIIKERSLTSVFDRIAANSSKRCSEYVFNKIDVGTVVFNEYNVLLSMDDKAKEIIHELKK
ncbi:MAG: cobalt-precorrin-5B (C(1))-methyltransferase CbiD [Bacillota bacterium]|nr:cobalt-precorrin-5B (C(1))-methyltransferase CbiD [Bacillota bacterium]